MKKIRENSHLIWLSTFIVVSVVAAILFIFSVQSEKIDQKVNKYTEHYLTDIMNENTDRIASKIETNFKTLEVLASYVGEFEDVHNPEVKAFLENQVKNSLAVKFDVIMKDGTGMYESLEAAQMMKQSYIAKAFNGKNTISDIITSQEDGAQEVLFTVPVVSKNGGITAVLQGIYDTEAFTDIVGGSVFSEEADTFIAQKDGTLVTKPDNVSASNIFTLLEVITSNEEKTISTLRKEISKDETGYLTIGTGNHKRYICYNKIAQNDWYSVTIMTYNAVEQDISDVSSMGVGIGKSILIVLLLLIAYIFGLYIWSTQKIRLNAMRYKIVAEQSENVIFECDCKTGKTILNENWERRYGTGVDMEDFKTEILRRGVIYEDDISAFESVFEELRSGKENVSKELRLYNKEHKLIWNNLSITAIRNRKNEVVRMIGRFTDIDRDKRRMEYFKEQSRMDLATGLYNKETTTYKIGQAITNLQKGMLAALLYVDIDDFKIINDQYGHNFGDHLIRKLTQILRDSVGDNSFAGRVGGDEFVLMIENISDMDEALNLANGLVKKAEAVTFPHHKGVELHISVGIAIAPDDGITPAELIKSSDMAMFQAKREGKHCAVLSKDIKSV